MWALITVITLMAIVAAYVSFTARLRKATAEHEKELAELRSRARVDAEKFQAQQRALFNSMTDGILVLDDRDAIQTTNRALHQIFSLPGDVIGKTVLEAFRLHTLGAIVERLKIEQQVLDCELEVPALKSHRGQWLHVNAATILDDDKRRLGAVLVFHDVTRLKQLENTRQEFVANVSHELRTPLSMIKGYAETLLGGAINDPAVSAKFLQTIERHSDRLTHLISDLLTISELESGRATLNLQPVHLARVVDSVFQDLRGKAEAQQITLHNNLHPELLVQGDGDRLRQVFWNLIENAIKYGKKHGNVWVNTSCDNGGAARITVRDDGAGIPADALPRIFERFYRVDKARSREAGGTGLGLSIVKHIVQSHGGKVWAESAPERGSAFSFTLQKVK